MLTTNQISEKAIQLKNRGNHFFEQEKYSNALDYYDQAIKCNANFKEAWLNKALCHQHLNQTDNAISALCRAIEILPLYAKAVYHKAHIFISSKNFERALETINNYQNQGGNNKEVIALKKECTLYFYVKQGHYSCFECDPENISSLQYGFYTEKFFNCIIFIFKSTDNRKISMFHAEYSSQIEDIKNNIAWAGEDCIKIIYMKEHPEADESLDAIFGGNDSFRKQFEIKKIPALSKNGKIILDSTVAALPDGSLAPEFESDVVWLDHASDLASKYHSDYRTCDDDRIIRKTCQEFQTEKNQIVANKFGIKPSQAMIDYQEYLASADFKALLLSFVKEGDYGTLRSFLDSTLININALYTVAGGVRYRLLVLAAMEGKLELVNLLLSRGADINLQLLLPNGLPGGAALYWAANRGYLEIVKILMMEGANPEIETFVGGSAISTAIQQGHQDIVAYFKSLEKERNPCLKEHNFFQGATQLNIQLNPEQHSRHISVDLHGSSVQESKKILAATFSKMDTDNITEFYVVTGWGSHINSQGSKGVLRKILPDLLKPYSLKIAEILEEKSACRIILTRALELERKLEREYQEFLDQPRKKILVQQYEKKISQGDVIAMIMLSSLHLHYPSGEDDIKRALDLLNQAKEKGSLQACVILGQLYRDGRHVIRNLKQAFSLFKIAADADYPLGQYWLGKCYLTGECVKRNDTMGGIWMKKAADNNVVYAEFSLGESYFKGDYTPCDEAIAFDYYKRAADKQFLPAILHVARSYACGYGVTQNYFDAYDYYLLAANINDKFAIYQVASYLGSNRLGKHDMANSFKWYLKGAELGDVDCQAMTALYYFNGVGIGEDIDQAVYWVTKAKEGEQKETLYYLLALMHFEGRGADHDTQKALDYLQQSANSGYEVAQRELVMRYRLGKGIPQDIPKAEALCRMYLEKNEKTKEGYLQPGDPRLLQRDDSSTQKTTNDNRQMRI